MCWKNETIAPHSPLKNPLGAALEAPVVCMIGSMLVAVVIGTAAVVRSFFRTVFFLTTCGVDVAELVATVAVSVEVAIAAVELAVSGVDVAIGSVDVATVDVDAPSTAPSPGPLPPPLLLFTTLCFGNMLRSDIQLLPDAATIA